MYCQLCEDDNVESIGTIPTEKIINGYNDLYKINVKDYFKDLNKVEIFRCKKTKYQFYYPSNLDGNGEFYEALEKFPWYYNLDKWEHKIS